MRDSAVFDRLFVIFFKRRRDVMGWRGLDSTGELYYVRLFAWRFSGLNN